jgi:hypothetical protein
MEIGAQVNMILVCLFSRTFDMLKNIDKIYE